MWTFEDLGAQKRTCVFVLKTQREACGRFPLTLWELREEHEGNASLLGRPGDVPHANGEQC